MLNHLIIIPTKNTDTIATGNEELINLQLKVVELSISKTAVIHTIDMYIEGLYIEAMLF